MAEKIPLSLTGGRRSQLSASDTLPLVNIPRAVLYSGNLHQSTVVSRSATTYAQIASFQLTPGEAGNYLFFANMQISTGAVNGQGDFIFAKNGTVITTTGRSLGVTTAILGLITLSSNTIIGTVNLQEPITCTATDVISVWYKSNGQTVQVGERQLSWIRIV